ncbi:hypothetical protein ACFJIX_09990 [Roseateles sp. UC29_93]|uniref:hypothetical protein n=1 Tax=Roseateles sp. UC29_93 TaxID=3350177 RepID=UPI003670DA6B
MQEVNRYMKLAGTLGLGILLILAGAGAVFVLRWAVEAMGYVVPPLLFLAIFCGVIGLTVSAANQMWLKQGHRLGFIKPKKAQD